MSEQKPLKFEPIKRYGLTVGHRVSGGQDGETADIPPIDVYDPRDNPAKVLAEITGTPLDKGLFDYCEATVDPRKLARRTDPETSHKAAEDIAPKVPRMERRILKCFLTIGQHVTANEVQQFSGVKAHKRMSAMVEKDWVKQCAPRRCTVTGKRVTTYAITRAGREALRS